MERHAYEILIVGIKPKVNIFDGKKKNAISTSGFQDKQTFLYFGYLPDVRFLKPVFKEISNNFYVFKAATYVEKHGFNRNCFAQMTNKCECTF